MRLQVTQQLGHRHIPARGIRTVQRGVPGRGEECRHPRGMLLDGDPGVRRKNAPGKHFQITVIALIVLGDGVAEPGEVTGGGRRIRLPVRQRRVGGNARIVIGRGAAQAVDKNNRVAATGQVEPAHYSASL